ncbi:MAG: AbrB/MazE/SpoVT family DNA-binding domain-containing protein [Clostridia bacterium]|nr:AbrB/MazE/SpoVT family DNA-binding domain-containing protein [Clostridia bacterium]
MKFTGIVRQIDSLGRVVIPKELRTLYGIRENDAIEIYTEDDTIILKKYTPSCIFCQSRSQITKYKDKLICAACLKELSELL